MSELEYALSKGLPSGLRQAAREVVMDGSHGASTPIYAYNKINSHLAGRLGASEMHFGSNAVNRSILKPRKKPNAADIHRERERQYRAARVDRELRRMIDRG